MNSIIIGNYYDQQERKSVTFIVLPKEINGKRIYKFYKFTPSKYDQDYLVKNEKFEIPRLFWKTEDGETVGMVVFTCIDFLSCDVSQLSYNNNITIVIMHSKELSDFTERIKAMIRRSLENNKGCVGVFVNAFGGDLAAAGGTGFYGIGQSRSKEICTQVVLGELKKFKHMTDEERNAVMAFFNKKVKDLTDEEEKKISDIVRTYALENDLRREVASNIKRLKELKTWRGMRHALGLPVRGQQTKTNAKTAKRLLGRSRVRPTLKK